MLITVKFFLNTLCLPDPHAPSLLMASSPSYWHIDLPSGTWQWWWHVFLVVQAVPWASETAVKEPGVDFHAWKPGSRREEPF